jgi:hypothetical protein
MLLFSVVLNNKVVIINPKLGDKVVSSETDSRISEFRNQSESEEKNAKSSAAEAEAEAESSAGAASSPCEWKFYKEQANDEIYNNGHRIMLTHQKVKSLNLLCLECI